MVTNNINANNFKIDPLNVYFSYSIEIIFNNIMKLYLCIQQIAK